VRYSTRPELGNYVVFMDEGMDLISVLFAVGVAGLVIGGRKPIVRTDLDRLDDFLRIRCPKCTWQPGKDDAWICVPGCGHRWNTFATRGRCPACGKGWRDTACLRCGAWSPHEEWYELREGSTSA
jgi:hypothetical protein